LNAEALCYGCHSLTGGTEERRAEVMTPAEIALLNEMKNDINRGREYRRTPLRVLSAHYRGEFEAMRATGRRSFAGYV